MSYDLYFTEPRISRAQFQNYFNKRAHYEVSESQVSYQNQDTGVYFLIDYNESEEEDPETISSTATLSLNYFRPHVFGLEAIDEISAFIEYFGFSIYDPQSKGMGHGPFSKDTFLRAWNHGNEFGYEAILRSEHAPQRVFTFPSDLLERIWKWNLKKTSTQESYSEDRFVPRIFFMNINGRPASVAVWPDAISELVPHVDYLIIGRDRLAPKSFFGQRKKDQFLVPICDLAPELARYATTDYALPAYELPAPVVSDALQNRIRKLKPTEAMGEIIPFDQILNEEIVNRYKEKQA